jgi:hypothetical protein
VCVRARARVHVKISIQKDIKVYNIIRAYYRANEQELVVFDTRLSHS